MILADRYRHWLYDLLCEIAGRLSRYAHATGRHTSRAEYWAARRRDNRTRG